LALMPEGAWDLLVQEHRPGDLRQEAAALPTSLRQSVLVAAREDVPDAVLAAAAAGGDALAAWAAANGGALAVALLPATSAEGHLVPRLALEASGFGASSRLRLVVVRSTTEAALA